MKKLLITSAAIAFVGTAVASNAAFAGGFLGDAISTVAPGVGTALDEEHARMGRPLDHGANAAAGVGVGIVTENPAAGAATTEMLEMRDAARRRQ